MIGLWTKQDIVIEKLIKYEKDGWLFHSLQCLQNINKKLLTKPRLMLQSHNFSEWHTTRLRSNYGPWHCSPGLGQMSWLPSGGREVPGPQWECSEQSRLFPLWEPEGKQWKVLRKLPASPNPNYCHKIKHIFWENFQWFCWCCNECHMFFFLTFNDMIF